MFNGTLFETQKPGAQFLCARKTGILAYEQGTGKTIISLASSEKLLETGLLKPYVLVLAPSAITWQWEEKIKEFTTNEATLVHAKSEFRGSYVTPTPYTITSYNLFRRDYYTLCRVPWDLVICDEAQEFKNHTTKTARLLKLLNTQVRPRYKWALTGTVISNKLEELYSIMYWVDPTFFPDWKTFEERHIVRAENINKIVSYKGLQSINESLPRRLNRKTQEEVGDMPELVISHHYIEKEKELKAAEDALLDVLDDFVDFAINSDGSLDLGIPAEVSRAFHAVKELLASPAKLKYAANLIQGLLSENPRNRVVVFSHFKQPLWDLRDTLSDRAIATFSFTGEQSGDEKRSSVRSFKDQSSVLLCSDAGKSGLDLPFANYLIHLDVPFSFEVVDQRNKRITRLVSQFNTVKANYLVVKGSFEEYYLDSLKAKSLLSEAVYTGITDTVTMRTQSLRGFLHDRARATKT